ncbi:hypothetical protein D0869_14956 [Hortaea werneckii]|uniref:CID domain-containing protein n=1 Tax=Hortaea werneckii TaxID=91943 RepID=A0A3M6W0N6_HORWE|nr:hypothetical protein D0869_14956 [Hortaea werneckii]
MAAEEGGQEFPDVSQKLSAPKKISAFEKERQAAEAKRLRAEEENAAALRAFQDSFGDEDEDGLAAISRGRAPPSGPRGAFGRPGGGNAMPPAGPKSGPGSLGPISDVPPPPSLKRKRALDEMREAQEAMKEQSAMGRDVRITGGTQMQEDDAEEAQDDTEASMPTLHLSNLPPDSDVSDVRDLFIDNLGLKPRAVQILTGPAINDSHLTVSALAMFDPQMKPQEIDAIVSTLKDKYIGRGYSLSISRHLSSAAMHPSLTAIGKAAPSEPFGAGKIKEADRPSMRAAPPPPTFASPEHYGSSGFSGYRTNIVPEACVSVQPPSDIETMRAIHALAERLLCEEDPQDALRLEAQLMALPEVQEDVRFAFLFDSQSTAGVYYRYLLWGPDGEDDDAVESKRRAQGFDRIFDDTNIDWQPPYDQVPFPDLTSLANVVTDMDYVSSDEESDDEAAERRFNDGRDGDVAPAEKEGKQHLRPLKRARLVHQLARLPTNNAKLRKGDVARVTNFAINHAGEGAEEIVDLLLLNVEKPLAYSLAARYEDSNMSQNSEDDYEPDEELPGLGSGTPQTTQEGRRDDDSSNAKLIGLYLISDILSASSTAGARNAWKYRQLFESGFKSRRTFEHLGKLDRELAWGRMKAEQWKRKIGVVFGIWEGWSVFSSDVHEELKKSFFEPPMSEAEQAAEQAAKESEDKKLAEEKWKGRFKRVEQTDSPSASESPANTSTPIATADENMDGAPLEEEELDGEPLNENLDGKPMEEDLDGAAMEEVNGAPMVDDADNAPMDTEVPAEDKTKEAGLPKVGFSTANSKPASAPKPTGPKRRMRAEDMFADSDEE